MNNPPENHTIRQMGELRPKIHETRKEMRECFADARIDRLASIAAGMLTPLTASRIRSHLQVPFRVLCAV